MNKNYKLTKQGKKAEMAMKLAVSEVIREHKLKGIPTSVWRNGRVVKI